MAITFQKTGGMSRQYLAKKQIVGFFIRARSWIETERQPFFSERVQKSFSTNAKRVVFPFFQKI
jgi:hypothetical protein